MSDLSSEKLFRWGVLLFLAFIWGSSFILMKIGLVSIPFEELGALRMFIAFLALMPFGVAAWMKIEKKYWKYLLIVGVCGNGAPAFLFAFAQSYISSSLAGMLNSLVPLFTLVVGLLIFKITPKKIHIFGVLIGLISAFFLLYRPGMDFNNGSLYGLYIVLATLCYSFSVNTIKKYLNDLRSSVITSTALLFIGPLCGIYLFFFTDFTSRISMDEVFLKSFLAIAVLSVFGTGLAIIIFNMLIKRVSALYASSVTYLIPVFAIMWGLIDGETIEIFQIIGMFGILTGIYLINR